MDKDEIKVSILRTISQEIDEWLTEEPTITDAFDYEKHLFERTLRMGRSILTNSQGHLFKDRNTKKVLTIFGRVELSKRHISSLDNTTGSLFGPLILGSPIS